MASKLSRRSDKTSERTTQQTKASHHQIIMSYYGPAGGGPPPQKRGNYGNSPCKYVHWTRIYSWHGHRHGESFHNHNRVQRIVVVRQQFPPKILVVHQGNAGSIVRLWGRYRKVRRKTHEGNGDVWGLIWYAIDSLRSLAFWMVIFLFTFCMTGLSVNPRLVHPRLFTSILHVLLLRCAGLCPWHQKVTGLITLFNNVLHDERLKQRRSSRFYVVPNGDIILALPTK